MYVSIHISDFKPDYVYIQTNSQDSLNSTNNPTTRMRTSIEATVLLCLVALCALVCSASGDEGGCAVNYNDPTPTCGDGAEDPLKMKKSDSAALQSLSKGTCVTEPGVDYPGKS